jgi:hypothetical protein
MLGALNSLSRLVAGEGKRRGCCGFFRNSRDARERVQETAAIDNCQVFLIVCPDFYFRYRFYDFKSEDLALRFSQCFRSASLRAGFF